MKKKQQDRICLKISGKHTAIKFLVMILSILFSIQVIAQTETIFIPSDIPPGEGNLNNAVQKAINTGKLSNTIFMLEPNGYYVLKDSILVPAGEHLTITAPELGLTQETAPPQILCSSGTSTYDSPVKVMFQILGNLTLKNLWLLYANTKGWQIAANVQFANSAGVNIKQVGTFENVVFDYSSIPRNASGAVGVSSKHFKGTFKNCYWKNCTDPHYRYYGRAVSFPFGSIGWHIDSLSFENCTFANIGYVYMQEGGEYADYVKFNHCTFFNVVMYPLESGWWNKLAVTNSIFVNTFMYGSMPAYDGDEPNGGTIRIDSISKFGFEVPFFEQDRRIIFTSSSYYTEKWLRDWMFNNPYSQDLRNQGRVDYMPIPQPMMNQKTKSFFESKSFPYMNMSNLYDSTNPGFILPPTDTTALKTFLYYRWYCSADSAWAWKPENSLNQLWPLEENLAYTNQELKTAGMGGFPLGDLYRWFPEKYKQWKAQENIENERISAWLETGKDPGIVGVDEQLSTDLPSNFMLFQNYPNPFNPITKIKYSIPNVETTRRVVSITLKVYDILGREITTLVNEEKAPGNYEVVFDGSKLASGVYLYRMKANDFLQTRKFLLLK